MGILNVKKNQRSYLNWEKLGDVMYERKYTEGYNIIYCPDDSHHHFPFLIYLEYNKKELT